jgi:hypothetical protein
VPVFKNERFYARQNEKNLEKELLSGLGHLSEPHPFKYALPQKTSGNVSLQQHLNS